MAASLAGGAAKFPRTRPYDARSLISFKNSSSFWPNWRYYITSSFLPVYSRSSSARKPCSRLGLLLLQRRQVGVAADRHDHNLAGAREGEHHFLFAGLLEQVDDADLGPACRQVE